MLHVGEHIYGVVDQVPGVMHVGTRIVHFNFLPCLPMGSVVVVDKRAAGEKMQIKTRFSLKSVVWAYVRLTLLWGGLILLAVGLALFDREQGGRRGNPPPLVQSHAVWMMALSALALLAWWYSHKMTHASYARAIELADAIGLDREFVDESFRARGLPTGDEPFAAAPAWAGDEKDDVYRLE